MLLKVENTPHLIIGTNSVLPAGFGLPPWVDWAYQQTSKIVFPTDGSSPQVDPGVDPGLSHLHDPAVQETYSCAAGLLASYGDTEPFDVLMPWRAAFYVQSRLLPHTRWAASEGPDTLLRARAAGNQRETAYLESPSRFFELMQSSEVSHAAQQRSSAHTFLVSVVSRAMTSAGIEELEQLERAWRTSDLKTFEHTLSVRLAEFPSIFIPCVEHRCREWGVLVDFMLRLPTPTLFVVGSLHVVGPDSLIQRLRERGWQLTFGS